MTENLTIRPYRPEDRAVLRRICCDTADQGSPVENFLNDCELVADFVTRYYTDFEPGSSWVAEVDGKVVGYLTATLDTHRQQRITNWRIAPMAILKAIWRGTLFRTETWRLFHALLKSAQGLLNRNIDFPRYPAHFHVDILDGHRGLHIGQKLVDVLLDFLRHHQCPGVHASVRGSNAPACAFFERMGFSRGSTFSIYVPKKGTIQHVTNIIFARAI